MRISSLSLVVVCMLASFAHAAGRDHPVKADLIADVTAVRAGETFHVAVRLTMQPEWHVYWINPGDAGLPTEVTFKAPAGFGVEFLGHPTPVQFNQPGDIVGYGYNDSLLLIAKVTAPADLKPGAAIELSADAKWLVCKEVCIPGKASPTLKLNVAAESGPVNGELFKSWLDRLPVPAAEKAAVKASKDGDANVLDIAWREPVKNVQVFTAPGQAWDLRDLKQTGDERRTSVRFVSKSLDPAVKSVEMPVVVAYDDAGGVRRSVKLVQHIGAD